MKIPKVIKSKIRKCGSYNEEASRLNLEIRIWLSNHISEEDLKVHVIDQLVDSLEKGDNLSEDFIDFLEKWDGSNSNE